MKSRFNRLVHTITESIKPSKKITSKKVIKEDIGDDEEDEGEGLTTDEWMNNVWEKAQNAVTDEMAKATLKYDFDKLVDQVDEYFEDIPEYFQDWLKEDGITEEEAFQKLVKVITDCGNEQVDDDVDWDDMYYEKNACFDDLRDEIKASPENTEAFKLALIELVLKEPEQSSASVDFLLMDPKRWSEYNFNFSDKLKQEIEEYRDFQGWMYERYWTGDDYCDWDIPERLIKEVGLNDYWTYIIDIVIGTYWGDRYYYSDKLQKAAEIEKEHPEFKKYGDITRAKAKR